MRAAVFLFASLSLFAQLKDRGRPYISVAVGYDSNGQYTSQFPAYAALVDQQFDMVQADNAQKFVENSTSAGVYNWTAADAHNSWAVAHGKRQRCHLVPAWTGWYPTWLGSSSPTSAQLQSYATDYIAAFFARFPGKCYAADIANELVSTSALNDGVVRLMPGDLWNDTPGLPYTQAPFREGIAALFTAARAADPTVKLCYNDNGYEFSSPGVGKSGNILNMIAMFQAHSPAIPIDCIGFQMHLASNGSYSYDNFKAQMALLAARGIESHITELDVVVPTSPTQADLDAQTAIYASVFQACLDTPTCMVFQTWGLSDSISWLGSAHRPLMFDTSYQKKAAYTAIANKSANLFPLPMGMHKRRQ